MTCSGSRCMVLMLMFSICLHGCSWKSKKASTRKSAEVSAPKAAVSKSSLVSKSLHALLQQQTLDVDPESQSLHGTTKIPIPNVELFATDGTQYFLIVNKSSGLAWVLRTGGIGNHIRELSGPWSTDSDAIAELLAAMNIDQELASDRTDQPGPESANNADSKAADSKDGRAD